MSTDTDVSGVIQACNNGPPEGARICSFKSGCSVTHSAADEPIDPSSIRPLSQELQPSLDPSSAVSHIVGASNIRAAASFGSCATTSQCLDAPACMQPSEGVTGRYTQGTAEAYQAERARARPYGRYLAIINSRRQGVGLQLIGSRSTLDTEGKAAKGMCAALCARYSGRHSD